ncbi:MAG: branched-chain amino acid ABC transporter permease [Proteobacteria bacterium]|nr:branched-chain amino acid ABC transporter permease [Pseudomonadota bacterium]
MDLAQNTLDGLASGAAYALLAVGFTLIFGVLRRVNLSYGPAIMFGCYAATWTHQNFGAGLLVLAAVAVTGSVLAGAYVERLCFAPHRSGSAVAAMVASFALWMQFEELAGIVMPNHLYPFPPLYTGDPLTFGPLTLRVESLVILGVTVCAAAALFHLLYRTRFGIAVRAIITQPVAASLSGIDASGVFVRVFAIGSAFGGLAGFLIISTHEQVTPMLGMWSTMKGLLAMMLGGLGSLPGAIAGGLALGLLEAHSQWFFGPQIRDLTAYLALFLLLVFRPSGLWTTTRSAS